MGERGVVVVCKRSRWTYKRAMRNITAVIDNHRVPRCLLACLWKTVLCCHLQGCSQEGVGLINVTTQSAHLCLHVCNCTALSRSA